MTHAAHTAPGHRLYHHPIAAALLDEALSLLGDGVPAGSIEAAALDVAFPKGVLAILDELSLDVIDRALHDELHALEHAQGDTHAHDDPTARKHGHVHDEHCGHDHDASSLQSGTPGSASQQHERDHDHDHDHGHDHDHSHQHGRGHDHGHHPEHGHTHAETHTHAVQPTPVALPTPSASPRPHVHKVKSKRMPESAVYVLEKMAHGYGRMGRSTGAGFYDYSSEPAQLWSGLKTFERGRRKIPAEDVRDRLVFAATLSALSVGTATDRAFTDTFGRGVPGNATAALDSVLLADRQQFVRRSRDLATRYGPRFEPSQTILDTLDTPAR